MKTGLALILLSIALLAGMPALAEPGDEPGCPWEHMPYREVLRMEEIREAQIVGGVKGSPYWLWQAYLGSGSIDLRLYDVSQMVFPKHLLFRERVAYTGNGDEKYLNLTVRDAQQVEMRVDAMALFKMEQAGIAAVTVNSTKGEVLASYAISDIRAIMAYFELEDEEILCLQGEDAPIFVHSADNVRRAVTAGN